MPAFRSIGIVRGSGRGTRFKGQAPMCGRVLRGPMRRRACENAKCVGSGRASALFRPAPILVTNAARWARTQKGNDVSVEFKAIGPVLYAVEGSQQKLVSCPQPVGRLDSNAVAREMARVLNKSAVLTDAGERRCEARERFAGAYHGLSDQLQIIDRMTNRLHTFWSMGCHGIEISAFLNQIAGWAVTGRRAGDRG